MLRTRAETPPLDCAALDPAQSSIFAPFLPFHGKREGRIVGGVQTSQRNVAASRLNAFLKAAAEADGEAEKNAPDTWLLEGKRVSTFAKETIRAISRVPEAAPLATRWLRSKQISSAIRTCNLTVVLAPLECRGS